MPQTLQSAIRDNQGRGKVGDFLRDRVQEGSKLSIVSAYFTIYAYDHLKDHLNSIDRLNFLFGEPSSIKKLDPEKTETKYFEIAEKKIALKNRLQQKSLARECAHWIKEKVDIKSIKQANLLHGKMYHVDNNGIEKALVGSSNFTLSGLGYGANPNIELNLEVDNDRDRTDLKGWFYEIWNDERGERVKSLLLTNWP